MNSPINNSYCIELTFIINFNNKMNNDDTFFNTLADFRDVKVHNQDQLQQSCQSSTSQEHPSQECRFQFNSNDKLLRNFKELREQLKMATHENQKLKAKLFQRENELDGVKMNDKDNVAIQYQLKSELKRLKEENEDSKSKLRLLKETAKEANKYSEELEYLKITICELKKTVQDLQEEKKKILEISIMEKVELEEKIKKYEVKENSDLGYVQDMEVQVGKLREKCIKLENQLKKAEIKYDEELYSKKWMNGNFEKEHLEQQLAQIERENQELQAKNKKEKERRNNLEKRVLELEELSGLWTIKAETFEVQNKALSKKFKKMERKMSQLKEVSDKKITETLTAEEKFLKAVAIGEQLISRVKRDLIGDSVALAKSCEYKLNKLKEEKDTFSTMPKEKESCSRKSPLATRGRSKSKARLSPARKLFVENDLKEENERPKFEFTRSELGSERLREIGMHIGESSRNKEVRSKPSDEETSQSSKFSSTNQNPLTQIDNIELRIRRERDEMEKKIREKMLYRQIEVANSPEKHRLREDYFRLIDK